MVEMDKALLAKAREYVQGFLEKEATGHDVFHTERVLAMSIKLAEGMDLDLTALALAALLHDLDDYKISLGTQRARSFLDRYCPDKTEMVMEIIENMSFSSHTKGKAVISIEGKIVQDADRLDALGAIGIARCFAYSGKTDRQLYKGETDDDSAIAHFYQKLLKLEALMNTDKAKMIAHERSEYMKEYLARFYQEWKGE